MEVSFMLHRCFCVALDPSRDYSEIPKIGSDIFGNRVSKTAVLRDSLNNFNILLVNIDNRLAFTSGLLRLLNHYNLPEGGWMRVFYLGGTEFSIEMMDREFNVCKDRRPFPHTYEFGLETIEKIEDEYNSGPEGDDGDILEYHDIVLSTSQIKKNRKALPMDLVRNAILPNKPRFCVLRDDTRRRFFCDYYWTKRNNAECSITTGWLDFVKANGLIEGSRIGFYINKKDPTIVHMSVLKD